MVFPFRNTVTGHVKLRTAKEVETQSYNALETNATVSGSPTTGSSDNVNSHSLIP